MRFFRWFRRPAGNTRRARARDPRTIAPAELLDLRLVVIVVWGVNFAVVKAGLTMMPPIAFVCAALLRRRRSMLLPFAALAAAGAGATCSLLSVVLGVVHFSLMFTRHASASTSPPPPSPSSCRCRSRRCWRRISSRTSCGWRRLTGMAIAFAGVVLIAGEPRLGGNLVPLLLVVAAACVWAFANIQIKTLGDDVDVWPLNGWVALHGGAADWRCSPGSPRRPVGRDRRRRLANLAAWIAFRRCWSRSSAMASGIS